MQTQYPFLLFSVFASVLYASEVWAATCTATPECASLGYKYSKEECPRGGLKCPTGDSYYCSTPRPKCHIGDIFYTDNTCVAAANHDSSKTVLGIVVYVNADGIGGQIMTPWWIDENSNRSSSGIGMVWSTENIDVLELSNKINNNDVKSDYDSCGNTDKIVAAGDASTYPAAWAARKYAPTKATAGKWCLPAAGVLRNVLNRLLAINNSMIAAGGISISGYWAWSSSEYDYNLAWVAILHTNPDLGKSNKQAAYYVRPVLEF